MKTAYWVCVVAISLFSPLASAQSCSGGADGGMDATGNQCNIVASATATDAHQAAAASTPNGARQADSARNAETVNAKAASSRIQSTKRIHPTTVSIVTRP